MRTATRRVRRAATALALALPIALVGCSGDGANPTSTLKGLPVVALAGVDGDVLQHLRTGEGADLDVQWLMVSGTEGMYDFVLNDTARAVLGGTQDLLSQADQPDLVSLGPVYRLADAFYSKSLTDVSKVDEGAKIVVPDTVEGQAEALRMLSAAGLISIGESATVEGISGNPKELNIVPAAVADLVPALDDAALVYVPAPQATAAHVTNPVLLEPEADQEVRILVARSTEANRSDVKRLYQLLTSSATRSYLTETWGSIVSFVS